MTMEYVSLPGESAPPVPDGPKLCNGDDMRILHNAFLWAYAEAPGLVRGAPGGDVARSEFLGQWLADLDATLHTHHESEDELLWGKLEQRAPACALHVGQMRAHHAQVAGLLEEASPLLARWRATADPAVGEQLADAYERMLEVLKVHLRREVVEVVPVAERVMSPGRVVGDGRPQCRGDPEESTPAATRDAARELDAGGPQGLLRGHAPVREGPLAPRRQAPVREAVPAAVPGQVRPTDPLTCTCMSLDDLIRSGEVSRPGGCGDAS